MLKKIVKFFTERTFSVLDAIVLMCIYGIATNYYFLLSLVWFLLSAIVRGFVGKNDEA